TLDIVHLGEELDVSPGFVGPAATEAHGRRPINVGVTTPMEVRVFSNGGVGSDDVAVEVRSGSADGLVVASGSVDVPAYGSATFSFDLNVATEGGFDLFTVVDPAGELSEAVEGNNTQKASLWAGPAEPSVLIVDDDGPGDNERTYA